MNVPLISAAIAGGTNFASGVLNNMSVRSTNATNMRIAQMNNEFNERMLDKQNAYNTDMWNKTNEYNSAANQVKRLQEAGLNPNLMLNGGSAGSASNVTSASGQPAQTPNIIPQNYDFINNVMPQAVNAMSVLADADNKNAQTEGLRIENQYKAADLLSNIYNKWSNTKNQVEKTNYQKLVNNVFNERTQAELYAMRTRSALDLSQIELNDASRAQSVAQRAWIQTQNQLTQKDIQYYDLDKIKDWQLKASAVASNYASADSSRANAFNAVCNALESQARSEGIKLDNGLKRRLANITVSTAYNQSKQSYYDALTSQNQSVTSGYDANIWNYGINKLLGPVASGLGLAAGFYFGRKVPVTKVKGFR